MGLKREPDLKVSEEAAVWLFRLHEEDTPTVRAEFDAWVRQGAANLQEFLLAQAIWKEMDHIGPQMRERLWSADDVSAVVDFPGKGTARAPACARRRAHRWMIAAAVAAVAVAGLGALSLWSGLPFSLLGRADVYATEMGEQKSVKLADGSVIHLNTASRAEVRIGEQERVIRLVSGEALFAVAPDPRRSFTVLTDDARIRALGTEFNVYRTGRADTRVAVVEGLVQVDLVGPGGSRSGAGPGASATDVRLKAGEEARISAGHLAKAQKPDIDRALSWRQRRLIFPGNPLIEIAEQFNRYNREQIRLEGESVRARRISGLFDADDSSPLLQYLERDPAVEVVRSKEGVLIRPKRR